MLINKSAPGCYGYAITCDPNQEACQKCAWLNSCRKHALQTLLTIQKDMDVSDQIAKHNAEVKPKCKSTMKRAQKGRVKVKKHELTENQINLLASLPTKTAKLVEQVLKKGIDIGLEVRSGINPFDEARPKFMRTPCRLLMNGGFTRATLKTALRKDNPDWSSDTLKSHESIAIKALAALNVITITSDGIMRLK